jgi:hypothetical protein
MDMPTSVERSLDGQSQRARIAALLRKYPDVEADETAEITRFLKKGPILEIGLLASDEELAPKVERFRAEHASKLGLSLKDYLLVALIIAALVAACVLLWDAGVA